MNVGPPVLSRDGRVVAYRAERNGRHFIQVGDREEPAFDFVSDPALSADGATVAYAGKRDNAWILVAGGRTWPLSRKPAAVFVSDDGRRVGWVDLEERTDGGSKARVVVEGEPGEPFGIVGNPVFSPDGGRVAYAADSGDRRYVVIGGRKFETPYRAGDPAFSADGRRVGYGARIGRELRWKVLEVGSDR